MLNQDYKEMLQYFLDEKVKFLLVGAYALAKHGLVRATGDIDLFVESTPENSKKIYKALVKFGAPIKEIDETSFSEKGIIYQIGLVPRRIDIITLIDGVSFDECWEHRETVQLENLKIPIISMEDLVKNKSSTGRTKDMADAEWLKENLNKSNKNK